MQGKAGPPFQPCRPTREPSAAHGPAGASEVCSRSKAQNHKSTSRFIFMTGLKHLSGSSQFSFTSDTAWSPRTDGVSPASSFPPETSSHQKPQPGLLHPTRNLSCPHQNLRDFTGATSPLPLSRRNEASFRRHTRSWEEKKPGWCSAEKIRIGRL